MTDTEIYQMPAVRFCRELMRRFAPKWLWIGVALFVAGMIAGIVVDVRWTIVGFMILLISIPQGMAVAYYRNALKPECFINKVPHSVRLEDGNIYVTVFRKSDDPELKDSMEPIRTYCFPAESVTGRSITDGDTYYEINHENRGFLWIPGKMNNYENTQRYQ